MLLSYITTESNGTLTLDQLLRGPLSLSAREVREAKRLGLTVDGAPFFANQRIGAGRTVAIPCSNCCVAEPIHLLKARTIHICITHASMYCPNAHFVYFIKQSVIAMKLRALTYFQRSIYNPNGFDLYWCESIFYCEN